MAAKYFAILTNVGAAKLANATALGTQLEITHMAVGDGGGGLPIPNPAQTALIGERRRAAINLLTIDPLNNSQIISEQVIPEDVGGWWIREVGLFDKDGTLVAIANCPETYKPQLQEGSGRTQTIRVILIVSSTQSVSLKIDPSVVLATRQYVDDKVLEVRAYADKLMALHAEADDPHKQYAKEKDVDAALKSIEEKVKINARPVLYRDWAPLRTAIPIGQAPADGQIIENARALYPDAWAAIDAGLVPVCSEAEWLANPSKRGCYTVGDGKTNFRVPDYNGKSAGALGAVVFRGDGKNAAPAGDVQGDAIREIEGEWASGAWEETIAKGGAIEGGSSVKSNYHQNAGVDSGHSTGFNFKASRVVPTAPENRMVNVAGCWTIHLFGAVLNSGSVDAAAVATAIAGLSARVSTLESAVNARKSTCLVNAVGTGAPHETVVAQLPDSVAINSRYVLPNPFGIDTPVICWAEVCINGVWADPCFVNSNGGHGIKASYVAKNGIVIQTGSAYLKANGSDSGSGIGVDGLFTRLPCRVFIRKLEA